MKCAVNMEIESGFRVGAPRLRLVSTLCLLHLVSSTLSAESRTRTSHPYSIHSSCAPLSLADYILHSISVAIPASFWYNRRSATILDLDKTPRGTTVKVGMLVATFCACTIGGVLMAQQGIDNKGGYATANAEVAVSGQGGMVAIPAGSFMMGDSFLEGDEHEQPVHAVLVSTFWMDCREITKAKWDEVRAWGLTNGYSDLATGEGKAPDHPVHTVNWYDCVKWCNARSQQNGLTPCYTVNGATYTTGFDTPECNWLANGFRLPTEAEWEKAARGGASGRRFPWNDSDAIQHSRANYNSCPSCSYDTSQTTKFHPAHEAGNIPYTSPVSLFAANGYGLYDMAGNVFEWCWDWYSSSYYNRSPPSDPRGPPTGEIRVFRGGCWNSPAEQCRVSHRAAYAAPGNSGFGLGFRTVRMIPQADIRK